MPVLNVPVEFVAKLTEPVGVAGEPAVEESVTLAVHVLAVFTGTELGEQVTLVLVVRKLTVALAAELVLPL